MFPHGAAPWLSTCHAMRDFLPPRPRACNVAEFRMAILTEASKSLVDWDSSKPWHFSMPFTLCFLGCRQSSHSAFAKPSSGMVVESPRKAITSTSYAACRLVYSGPDDVPKASSHGSLRWLALSTSNLGPGQSRRGESWSSRLPAP